MDPEEDVLLIPANNMGGATWGATMRLPYKMRILSPAIHHQGPSTDFHSCLANTLGQRGCFASHQSQDLLDMAMSTLQQTNSHRQTRSWPILILQVGKLSNSRAPTLTHLWPNTSFLTKMSYSCWTYLATSSRLCSVSCRPIVVTKVPTSIGCRPPPDTSIFSHSSTSCNFLWQ
jgi:hypothetical protein